jgi:hypothetical protein
MRKEPVLKQMPRDLRKYWGKDISLIYHHHQRGADELPHRGLKAFGSEQLPFNRFAAKSGLLLPDVSQLLFV